MVRAVLIACAAAAIVVAVGTRVGTPPAPSATVDPRVLADTADGASARFVVVLRTQADVPNAVRGSADRSGRGHDAVDALRAAAAGQARVSTLLDRLGAPHRGYWIVNAVAVRGDRTVVDAVARLPEVAEIQPDRSFRGLTAETGTVASAVPRGVEWNVAKIGAPAVWAQGATGQGLVYANADTGVGWEAPALKRQYRGWDGATASHDYNWWDAVHGDLDGNGTNPCGFDTRAPCDDDADSSSHGTHAMGTAVGDDGAGNQVGVAPGARWISCRNMDEGIGRPSTYIECLQFFLAPTDLNGANPDPSRRPDVVGNSYSCPPDEGCAIGALQAAVDAMRAAGVFMAVAAGNEGEEGCSTVQWPPAVYDSAISVGATDAGDRIASFSSRGPVTADGSRRRKPDLSAPGLAIRSARADGRYGELSGTSMAAPHVAGAVLLLWSAFPDLRGNVDATERLLADTAVPRTSTQTCGNDTPTSVPNNTYGYGRIDVAAAYRAVTATAPSVAVRDVSVIEGGSGRRNAVFTLVLSAPAPRAVTVTYRTRNGTAKAGSDFVATSGSIRFAAGERARAVPVPVRGDRRREANETFTFALTGIDGATRARAVARGTIRNDD